MLYITQNAKRRARKKHAAEREEALFKQPPRGEDCPICFVLLPEAFSGGGQRYGSCCGKMICCGCLYAYCVCNTA
jgi:hypothetical protein